ncbi:MAG: hypothetical protein M3083_01070 [Actinomycetota bacterium]|nr:hypothetical protein [Actinomycetota bacterium]MDQ6946371.1 hypothetical protein [Actinomycetota bacterium]
MAKRAAGGWSGRHPIVCAIVMAIGVGSASAFATLSRPTLIGGIVTAVAIVVGAGLGLLFSSFNGSSA